MSHDLAGVRNGERIVYNSSAKLGLPYFMTNSIEFTFVKYAAFP